jgi:hypothetical protein
MHGMTVKPEVLCECEKLMTRGIIENITGVDAGFTAAKIIKQKKYQDKRNAELDVRKVERYGSNGGMSLKPNFEGQRLDSWQDAKKLAAEQGKSTKGYDRLIESEKRMSGNSKGIDEKAWKEAKRKAS